MKESLPLSAPFFLRESVVVEGWKMCYASLEEGKKRGYQKLDFDDSEWESAQVPKLYRATFENDTIWYRTSLRTWSVKKNRKLFLRFEGSFLITDVWLNGKYLGGHYGYFAPFGFDVTDLARDKGENVLAVCVQSPPESDLRKKKHVMGVFNGWDCKPYPDIGTLPKEFEWYVPLGIWRKVIVGESGSLIIEHIKTSSKLVSDKEAAVEFGVRLRNLTVKRLKAKVQVDIAPQNFRSRKASIQTTSKAEIPPNRAVDIKPKLVIKNPALWWCWTHGKPNLYLATIKIEHDGVLSAESKVAFGIREVKANMSSGKWEWFLNGRRIFPKGTNYISNFMLDRSNVQLYAKDLNLLKNANMDFVRVHAHIDKEEFYAEADKKGMLVMCDFTLNGCYVYEAPQEDVKFFEEAVRSQIPEMVNFLYNHPSIVIWNVHNEPPWLPLMMLGMGATTKPGINKAMDLEAKEMINKLDSTRPAIAASGDMDEHLYHGWYLGEWDDFNKESPGFPTEFGAQSLPNMGSKFWKHVKTKPWPIDDQEPTWLYADYQPLMWAINGVGSPKAFKTLNEYITEGQKYQAFLCKFAAERFRTLKFNPTGGMVHFMFVDCHPAITWSIVDYYRNPKLAYWAMKQAFNPTHVCIDLDGNYQKYRYSAMFKAGGQFKAPLHIVNDSLKAPKEAVLKWSITGSEGKEVLSGSKQVSIPAYDEEALKCHEIVWNIPTAEKGVFKLELKLSTGKGKEIDANEVEFFVG